MASSIKLKSIQETLKWLVIWLTAAVLVLDVLSQGLIFDISDGLDALLIIALLMLQHRLELDESTNQIDIKIGVYFFNIKIITFSHHIIDVSSIETITCRERQAVSVLSINYTSAAGKLSTYTFRCFKQAKLAQLLVSKLSTVERVYTAKREEAMAAQAGIASTDDFSRIFPQHNILGNAEAKNTFSILRCALPLPDCKKKTVYFIVACFGVLTSFIAFSSQNWKASMAFLIITYISYWLARAFVCNKYYFIKSAPLSSIVINDDELYLPALLFSDQTPRTLTKADIISIEATWNYDYRSIDNSMGRKTKRAHVISLVFNTEQGQSLALSHFSVDGIALVFSLIRHHYPVSLYRTPQMVYPIKKHVGLILVLFIVSIIIINLPNILSVFNF